MAKKTARRILKVILWIIVVLLLLFAILWGLLQVPSFQNWVVKRVTNSLERTLDTKVSIDRVNIKFFKTASIKGIYVEDHHADTLLYAGELDVSIGLFDFFQREIFLNDISLSDAIINLHSTVNDSTFNYQFIIDAFVSDVPNTPVADTSAAGWAFGLDKIKIQHSIVRYNDVFNKSDISARIGLFDIGISKMDLDKLKFDLSNAQLQNANISVQMNSPPSSESSEIIFPDLGVEIYLDKLTIDQSYIQYHNNFYKPVEGELDANHLDLDSLNISVSNVKLFKEEVSFEISEGHFSERDGIKVIKLKTKFLMTPEEMVIPIFELVTPTSSIAADAILSYGDFSVLGDFENRVTLDVVLQNTEISAEDLKFLAPAIKDTPLNLSDKDNISLTGKIDGRVADLKAQSLSLRVGNRLKATISGSIKGLPDVNKIKTDVRIQNIETSYEDLKAITKGIEIPEGIKTWGKIKAKGSITGGLDLLKGTNVEITTSGKTQFKGDFLLKHLNDMDRFTFETDVRALTTRSSEIQGFSETELPAQIDSLGVFSLKGKFKGTTTDFSLDGSLSSEVGDLDANLSINFSKDYKNAQYNGKVGMKDFNLGRFLADESNIGLLSLDIETKGSGLSFEDITANLKGRINSLEFRGYEYKDFYLDGRLAKQKFLGIAGIEDENITLDFDGQVDFSGEVPDFIFTANIDTINFHTLNLMADTLGVRGVLRANFVGKDIDGMEGFVHLDKPGLTTSDGSFQTDRVSIFSNKISADERELTLRSDLMTVLISGDYKLLTLPALMTNFVNDYFPLNHLMSPVDNPDSLAIEPTTAQKTMVDENFTFEIIFSDPTPLTKLFVPDLTRLDTGYIKGALNTKDKSLVFNAFVPDLEYAGTFIDSIRLTSAGDVKELRNALKVYNVNVSPTLQIPEAIASLQLENDSAFFDISIKNNVNQLSELERKRLGPAAIDSLEKKFGWGGVAGYQEDGYQLKMNSPLLLNGYEWKIDNKNVIVYNGKNFFINKLNLYKPGQEILISTLEMDEGDETSPVEVGFRQFQLAEISKLLDRDTSGFYDGKANGNLLVRNITNDLSFLADLVVQDLSLNKLPIGTAIMSASQENSDRIDVEVNLVGPNNDIFIEGSYNIDEASIDMVAEVKAMELRVIDPFLETLVHDSKGILIGNLDITGPAISPDIKGNVTFNDASTVVDFLNIRYSLPNHKLDIKDKTVAFGKMKLFDPNGNESTLTGDISYVRLDDIRFNLDFATNRFQVINTTQEENELFYGSIFVSGNAEIRGNAEKPMITVNAKTLSGTNFAVQPLTYEQSLSQENFIIFANPEIYQQDTTITLNDLYKLSGIGVELRANLEITSDAKLEIIIDPATGDKLVCRGDADLVVNMNPLGDLSVVGNYTLTSGQYTFVFQGVLKKNFEIEPGSTVSFIGDPLDSKFNIQAKYSVRTATYPLIASQTNPTETEIKNARRKTDVDVEMNMTGDLITPAITFDIAIPEGESGNNISSSVAFALSQLRENESDLNKQVFGLLLLNGFLASESSSQDNTLTNFGLSSVSDLLSSQLNTLAKKFIKGVDLDFGIDSYKSGFGNETVTEFQVGASKSLLNDRLTMRVGGNVNNSSEQSLDVSASNNATFSGDFVIEYQLTPDGDYQLRFYQLVSSEKNVFNPGANYSETGVAIFFTKSFNSKKYALKLKESQKLGNEN